MSAATEALVDKIRLVEQQIAAEPQDSPSVVALRSQLTELQKRLMSANEALTEGKQLLKS
jgi:hypothetical protein